MDPIERTPCSNGDSPELTDDPIARLKRGLCRPAYVVYCNVCALRTILYVVYSCTTCTFFAILDFPACVWSGTSHKSWGNGEKAAY